MRRNQTMEDCAEQMAREETTDALRFDGVCPFLFCEEDGLHWHPLCRGCRVVRAGPLSWKGRDDFCPQCQEKEKRP